MNRTLQDIHESYVAAEQFSDAAAARAALWSGLVAPSRNDPADGYGFLQVCWYAIKTNQQDLLGQWLTGQQGTRVLGHMGTEDPHNRLAFLAHLQCALAVARRRCSKGPARPFSASEILEVVRNIEKKAQPEDGLSVAYVRDLLAVLSMVDPSVEEETDSAELCRRQLCQAQRTERISVLLVDVSGGGKEKKGHVGTLSLELVERDEEFLENLPVRTLYPTPLLSLIARDEAFRSAESNARDYVLRELGHDGWQNNHDVRWDLHLQDREPLPSVLVGDSLGGAFALGLLKVLSSRKE